MALKLGNKTTRTVQIDAVEPGDNDKITRHSFTVEYKILSKAEWTAELKDNDRTLIDSISENIVHIDGILDEDGNAVKYSEAVKEAVLAERWLYEPLIDGYLAVQGGKTMADYKKAKAKN